jgi:hypothetical protein
MNHQYLQCYPYSYWCSQATYRGRSPDIRNILVDVQMKIVGGLNLATFKPMAPQVTSLQLSHKLSKIGLVCSTKPSLVYRQNRMEFIAEFIYVIVRDYTDTCISDYSRGLDW